MDKVKVLSWGEQAEAALFLFAFFSFVGVFGVLMFIAILN